MDDSLSESLRRVEALKIGHADSREDSTAEALRQTAENQSAGSDARRSAFTRLAERSAGEPGLSEVILTLIDDPDIDLARDAIAAAPPFDGRVMARLRQLLDDARPSIWEAGAMALSRKKDHSILPIIVEWARRGDRNHRRVGLSAVAFLLTPEPHLAFVESVCEEGPRDDEDEAVLVSALRVAELRVTFWRKALGEPEP